MEKTEILGQFENFSTRLDNEILRPANNTTFINHYTSPSGFAKIIENKTLRFTEYAYLNDNTEGDYIFEVLEDMLLPNKRSEFNRSILEELRNPPFNEIYDITCKYYFVCCFSEDDDSLPMWNYYTKTPSRAGYNIRFYYNGVYNAVKNFCHDCFFESYKIMYGKDSQQKFLRRLLNFIKPIWEASEDRFIIRVALNYLHSVRLAFKHIAFAPEKEIRFVIKMEQVAFEKAMQSRIIKFNERNGIMVPYVLIPYENKDIRSIRLSPLIQNDNAEESVKLFLRSNDFNENIKIELSDVPVDY